MAQRVKRLPGPHLTKLVGPRHLLSHPRLQDPLGPPSLESSTAGGPCHAVAGTNPIPCPSLSRAGFGDMLAKVLALP